MPRARVFRRNDESGGADPGLVDERWARNEPDCHKFFKALGRIGKAQGLVWGSDWVSFRDWARLQGRQNSELAAVKRESGL